MFRIKFSREVILKILYQIDVLNIQENDIDDIIQNSFDFFKALNIKEKEFIKEVISEYYKKKENIDNLISENLIGWKLSRLTTIDRNLLRMGIAESYNNKKAIIIDDIVRIAKKYGGEDSYKIINAILDKVIE
jgi:N utilization substance protein B